MAIGKNNEDWDAFLSNKKFANCESFGIILLDQLVDHIPMNKENE